MATTISDGTTTIAPELVLGYETSQAGGNLIHAVLGRRDPDVTLREAGLRAGTLQLFFLTEVEAEACRVLHSAAAVFAYTADDNTTTSMNYVVDPGGISTKLDDSTRRRWVVSVGYQEVPT
jgi:hypothetical protein